MPLGLAKDSMVNLAEMVHHREEHPPESDGLASAELAAVGGDVAGAAGPGMVVTLPATSDDINYENENVDHEKEPEVEANVEETSYGKYSGFAVTDYSDYEHFGDYYSYRDHHEQRGTESMWCCLFPWLVKPSHDDEEEQLLHSGQSVADEEESTCGIPSRAISDDEISTGSAGFGEKLTEKERQAVLARLRLIEADNQSSPGGTATGGSSDPSSSMAPDEATSSSDDVRHHKGLLTNLVPPSSPPTEGKLRSILKRPTMTSRSSLSKMNDTSSVSSKDGTSRRRALFPSYESTKRPVKDLKTDFSPMARVLSVKSHKDMDFEEKSGIWWQRSDYEEFRKTGRMITKAMLQGGSEIWLATNQSWMVKDRQSTLKHAYSLAESEKAFQKGDVKAKAEYEEARDKWWHKFGHSRRGLEHIASIDEGRQRQGNVRTAIQAVLEEQRKQKAFHREDPEKIRMVAIQHTSWARDLAMAAGASDADAVRMNFDDESRKSREFYLLKFSRTNQMNVHATQKASVPAFMQPALTAKVEPNRLDANTVTQIRYRQQTNQKRNGTSKSSATPTTKTSTPETVPVKDESDPHSSMAKQAAGFASGEEIGNMSSVLTGMGPIPVVGGV
eukprot:Nitzschia sp. Nitz4//scaffold197_size40390//18096//19943//NITZ4_007516-RA/size40390-processed-gene-0.3-mRNA-1//1//CDS//3329540481//3218//frame0